MGLTEIIWEETEHIEECRRGSRTEPWNTPTTRGSKVGEPKPKETEKAYLVRQELKIYRV